MSKCANSRPARLFHGRRMLTPFVGMSAPHWRAPANRWFSPHPSERLGKEVEIVGTNSVTSLESVKSSKNELKTNSKRTQKYAENSAIGTQNGVWRTPAAVLRRDVSASKIFAGRRPMGTSVKAGATKTPEQSENVYENKGSAQKSTVLPLLLQE